MLLLTDWQIAYKIYRAHDMPSGVFIADDESAEYAAGTFTVNGLRALYREARITPTKTGLFVTLWKRSPEGPIAPFEVNDPFDLAIIGVRKQEVFGQFIFPKRVLVSKGIVSSTREGKRGFRVYPPWSETSNRQAQQTQKWQSEFFIDLSGEHTDKERINTLLAFGS